MLWQHWFHRANRAQTGGFTAVGTLLATGTVSIGLGIFCFPSQARSEATRQNANQAQYADHKRESQNQQSKRRAIVVGGGVVGVASAAELRDRKFHVCFQKE